ncbi:MAG: alpha/beta hydrolase-fold protein [Planctomycetota bacterium]|nr:alpha/beta hydrolase-fold protein [Planctomycetota bacterium]
MDGEWRRDGEFHSLRAPSSHLRGPGLVEVLAPRDLPDDRAAPTVYVLPVERDGQTRFGDGLREIARLGLHESRGIRCVSMSFDEWPWFGAHATDPRVRHEDHLLEVVLPTVEARFASQARLLLGFSKSGWGALSLIFRNPDRFGCAVSWDAPLMLDASGYEAFYTGAHFGTLERFLDFRPLVSARASAHRFRESERVAVLGYDAFGTQKAPGGRDHTQAFHEELDALGIPHVFRNDLTFAHRWDSGWLPQALEILLDLYRRERSGAPGNRP